MIFFFIWLINVFVLSVLLLVLASFTSSNTAAIASAVLKSSSIEVSNLPNASLVASNTSFSFAVSSSSLAIFSISVRLDTAVIILSRPFLADSIRSWLKLIGFL